MSVRQLRRTFASPFVITLAAIPAPLSAAIVDAVASRLAPVLGPWRQAGRIVDEYRSVSMFSELLRLLSDLEAPYPALCTVHRLIGDEPGNGELLFFRGEAFRLRNASGDPEKALAAYQSASETQSPPAELFRSMGLLQRKIGQPEAARQSFRIYLQSRPNAEDAELIRVYLEEGS